MRIFNILLLIAVITVGVSCKKTPSACIDGPSEGFVVKRIGFTNCSDDYDFSFWSFGDGNGEEERDASHRYNNPGKYVVKLTAYSDDGRKEDEASMNINVGYKVIDSVIVESWGFSGFADAQLQIDGVKSVEKYIAVSTATLPVKFTFAGNLKLTQEFSHVIILNEASPSSPVFNQTKSDFHLNLDNPYTLSENPMMKVYWHFEFE